ncbi:FKBP12-interacting protein of 37 kDa isoform X1 [Phoenix dactylifera]|uniref:FKBP12-interacting protein of 37 kDa isoform X1 n=1 Tax=Phoenix dactylifera TaxID=42345 RepID=A0A8B9A8G5_PHODC|nr:FKBP12-interacting protein of 37 kDa isoform X1 [Phoenix dactylifera]XP_038982945.1 FKBP12-interacting protein of 37 kDa isoform X1 [Phoenix dactylifera]XP_038982946.1 FKBP12-interacting protein of 37 kDa isoform X1 [Phoenix dactylifera]
MASHSHLDDEDDFGGDFSGSHSSGRRTGDKRTFGDLDEEEDDVFGPKKGKSRVEESGPGAATGMILSLRESLQNCKDNLATCQAELEAARSEIQKWHSAFQNGPTTPAGISPEPGLVVTYLQNLKTSEESLKEQVCHMLLLKLPRCSSVYYVFVLFIASQLEKAKKREAAFIVTFAKREQEIADLKSAVRDLKTQLRPPSMQTRRLLLDPAIHEEFTRLKNLVEEKEKKIKELQDNVAAVNFTTSSKLGQMLVAKCRTLQVENEEIGAMASEGKIHELGMKIAVLKSQNAELRNQFDALYKHMEGLTNDVERSNEMVYILQEKLEAKDCELKKLKEMLSQKETTQEGDESADEKKAIHDAESAEVEA